MEELSKLLFELSNEDRLRILEVLNESSTKLTPISNKLDLTVQETSRHLARMTKAGLIQKRSDGGFSITPYGQQLYNLLPSFSFLVENQEYFMTHTFSDLPLRFINRIGELAKSILTDNAIVLFQYVDGLIAQAEEYVWIMSDQALSSTFPLLEESLGRGAELKVLLPSSIGAPNIPEEMLPDFSKFRGTLLEPRHLQRVSHVVILSEKEAILALPDLEGRLDYLGFRVSERIGHRWCHDLFLEFWEQGQPVIIR
ncbi:MAG: winged helix-turn-helix domain-containing protein [Candidatus Thorarchaeota archaeon]